VPPRLGLGTASGTGILFTVPSRAATYRMRIPSRRLFAVALLPLLIWMLSGWTGPGGWYCASGSQCEPPRAVTCCCGARNTAPDDCCDSDGGERHASLSGLACGCYYQGQAIDARLETTKLLSLPVAPLAESAPLLFVPRARAVFVSLPGDTRGPPRLLTSSRVTRSPPAA
jgi:hypothetical protein